MSGKNKAPYRGPQKKRQMSIRLDDETQDFLDREALALSSQPPFHDISASDVVRFAIRKYREDRKPAAVDANPRSQCDLVKTDAGSYCTTCGQRSGPNVEIICTRSQAQ